jgi:hypothetical protein
MAIAPTFAQSINLSDNTIALSIDGPVQKGVSVMAVPKISKAKSTSILFRSGHIPDPQGDMPLCHRPTLELHSHSKSIAKI